MVSKPRPPDLIITIDFGGSLTKAIFADCLLNEQLLVMEPEVISVPPEAISNYESSKLGRAQPADSAWVTVDDQSYVVGYLARSKFNGNPGLSSLKYERAFPKTLAAVWVAAQILKLNRRFTVAISILMPSGEHESGKLLEQMLRDALKKFHTPTGQIQATLSHFDCKPEGGGIYMIHRSKLSPPELRRKIVAIVMVGYRNASVLLAERGQVGKRSPSDLGFIKMVRLVEERITGLPATAELARAIALAGEKIDLRHLERLAMSSVPEVRRDEVQHLGQVIKACRAEYALALSSWLKEVLPRRTNLDEVVLCGGTAEYMSAELEMHFSYTEISWNAGIEIPENLQDEEIGSRMCDAYGTYLYFRGVIAESLGFPTAVAASG